MQPETAPAPSPIKERDRVLKGLGLTEVGDAFRWLPKTYRDYRNPSDSIRDCHNKGKCLMVVEVVSCRTYSKDGLPMGSSQFQKPYRLSLRLKDETGFTVWATVFGALFPWKDIKPGNHIAIYGEVQEWNGNLQISSPELVPYGMVGKMLAIHRGKRGRVAAEAVTKVIRELLENDIGQAAAVIEKTMGMKEEAIIQQANLRFNSLVGLINGLHRPESPSEAFLATTEAKALTIYHLKRLARLVKERPSSEKAVVQIDSADVLAMVHSLPYELTEDQTTTISEILHDLQSDIPMRRLLSGDVGTGKTLTYLIPAIASLRKGAIVMVLSPNVLLTEQLAEEVERFFPGTATCLVRGGGKRKLNGKALLIGTTALLSAALKAGLVPDLLICDEQHRLSKAQRESLMAGHTNLLEATATAVPRSVALATHGGMDVSILKQSPVEKSIVTRLVTVDQRGELFEVLGKIVRKGGQIAIVYPRLEAEADSEKKNSVIAAAKHWERLFPGQVVMLHGRMTDSEKVEILESVKSGAKQILISSTVIENGLTIKGLRGLMVVDPDCYGVSQLHQLRGRLARLGGIGYMFMYLTKPIEDLDEDTLNRLELVTSVSDGFELAEKDAYARGFGDISGDGQSQNGEMPFLFYGIKITPKDLAN